MSATVELLSKEASTLINDIPKRMEKFLFCKFVESATASNSGVVLYVAQYVARCYI